MTRPTYKIIAPHYNWIMEHVDYPVWAQYLKKLTDKHAISLKNTLEVGAGTCPFAGEPLYAETKLGVFSDLSFDMLNHATPQPTLSTLPKVQCTGAKLPFKEAFDSCLMIYDTFNHFLEEKDIMECFDSVYHALVPGGHFIFDITTEFNSLTYFYDSIDFEENKNISMVRESWYDEKNSLQNNLFTYFIKKESENYIRIQESHRQKIYSPENIVQMIDASAFALLASYDDLTFNPPSENTERIHYVLKK